MSLLLSCQSISKSFGPKKLFHSISLGLSEGDKVGMIGPNGSGKSTFLKILAGTESPDQGECSLRKLTRCSYVPQISVFPEKITVEDVLIQAIEDQHLEEYEKVTQANIFLSKVGFEDPNTPASTCSGGWKKRLAIASALVNQPDILLLDEPTNHLDLEGILWLEDYLSTASFAFLVISHDRYFLEKVSKRIIELNPRFPEGTFQINGGYSDFLLKRQDFLTGLAQQQESLSNKVRHEVEWLKKSPKARTTKARFRIQQTHEMMDQLSEMQARQAIQQHANIDFTSSGRKTKELLVAKDIAKTMGKKSLFQSLSFILTSKQCLGLVGPNGCGKTTFLKVITNQIKPDHGTIKHAENLRIVYFDQHREDLDPTQTLRQALSPDGDHVIYKDRSYHVASWAKRFLFRPEQIGMQIGLLSGGEQARILIARFMLEPADLLILDEPTNDLDLPTLNVLEESLLEFSGAIVLVTHDRYMLDQVCNGILGFDAEENPTFFADYAQWLEKRNQRHKPTKKKKTTQHNNKKNKTLTYHEKKEWESMETTILEAEEHLQQLQEKLKSSEISSDSTQLQLCFEESQKAQQHVEQLYQRWTELEEKHDNN